ncbi:MAG: hypothetical protein KJ072_19975 [Verrucomicrobia bacterium]|nr:hypothetical protein [Verrucomicrobiota bacterium]
MNTRAMEFTVDRDDSKHFARDWFVRIAMGVLVITAILKLISVASEARGLGASDPLFDFLTTRQVLLLAAMFELGTVVAMVVNRNVLTRCGLLLWISAVFVAYRVGLAAVGFDGHCPCLGALNYGLPISPAVMDRLALGLLVFMVAGSLWCGWSALKDQREPEPREVRC